MKQLFVVNPQSFIDLITNSSSELFIAETDKTISAVKDILEKLIKEYNFGKKEEVSFDSVFGKIDICKINFDWQNIPRKLKNSYEAFRFDGDKSNKFFEQLKNIKSPKERTLFCAQYREKEEKAKLDIYNFVLKENSLKEKILNPEDIYKIDYKYGIGFAISYQMKLVKGAIQIHSRNDNSVPYEIQEKIVDVLNAQRYHLG